MAKMYQSCRLLVAGSRKPAMKSKLALLSLTVLFVAGCGKPPAPGGQPVVGGVINGAGPNPLRNVPSRPTGGGVPMLEFTPYQVKDEQVVAYTYLMPKGWKNDDSIKWMGGKLPYPLVKLYIKPEDGSHWIAFFPMIGGNSWSGQYGSGGTSYESAGDAIDQLITKTPGTTDYNVLHESTRPAKTIWPPLDGSEGRAEVCVKRVTFTRDGEEKEGIFVAKLDTDFMNSPGSQTKLWHLSLQVMVAPKGALVSDSKFLKQSATFFASASITPEYNQLVNKVSFDASQINRKEALDEDRQIMKNYWDGQKGMERGMKDFDDYIRGVQDFGGKNGGPRYSLPSGGRYWTDRNGNIGTTDDPNFDPNQQDGGGGWSPLAPTDG